MDFIITTKIGDIRIKPQGDNTAYVESVDSVTVRGCNDYTFRTWARRVNGEWVVLKTYMDDSVGGRPPQNSTNFYSSRRDQYTKGNSGPTPTSTDFILNSIQPDVIEWLNNNKEAISESECRRIEAEISSKQEKLNELAEEVNVIEEELEVLHVRLARNDFWLKSTTELV